MKNTQLSLDRPVTDFLSTSAITLRENLTVEHALIFLRATQPNVHRPSQVLYFYVLNDLDQLVGVLPARQLILSPSDAAIRDLMMRNIIALSPRDTLADALELFALHRLLAIPAVDDQRRLLGVVEVSLYTDEVFDLAQNQQMNEVFQLMGLHLEQHKQGSPLRGFKLRMPWLLANITGGLICAALGSFFEATLAKVVVIALFIPLILTLAESIAVQSMTLAIEQAATGRHRKNPGMLLREVLTAALLGLCTGAIVGAVSLLWKAPRAAPLTIAAAVAVTMVLAAIMGRLIPSGIHLLNLNPGIASGPITLATVDILSVSLYLAGATAILT